MIRVIQALGILSVLLFPTQATIHFWPDFSTILGRRVDYLSPSISLVTVVIFLFCVLSTVQPYSWHTIFKKISTFVHGCFDDGKYTSFVLFGLGIALNIANADIWLISLYRWVHIGLFVWWIICLWKTISNKHITYAFIGALLWSSVLSIGQFVHNGSLGGALYLIGERTFTAHTPDIANGQWCLPNRHCFETIRPYATFPHPNVLGGALVMGIYILTDIFLKRTRVKPATAKTRIAVFISFLFFIALLFTQSRSSWLALLCTIPVFVMYVYKTHVASSDFFIIKKSVFILAGIGIILGICAVVLYGRPVDLRDDSVTHRVDLMRSSFQIFASSPIVGVGLNNFIPSRSTVVRSPFPFLLQPVHNVFLLLASETGILGMVVAARAFYIFWKRQHNYIRIIPPLMLLVMLGMFDHYLYTIPQGQLSALLFIALNFF